MNENSDEGLLEGLREGIEEAQQRAWDSLHLPVYQFVRGLARNKSEHDAEEITRDAFLRAFNGIRSFRGECALKTWLINLARNAAIDYYRVNATRPSPLNQLDMPKSAALSSSINRSPESSPSQGILEQETRDNLEKHLAKLTEDQRTAVTLRILENLSYVETAKVMNKSEGSVKMLIARGLDALAKMMHTDPFFKDGFSNRKAAGHEG